MYMPLSTMPFPMPVCGRRGPGLAICGGHGRCWVRAGWLVSGTVGAGGWASGGSSLRGGGSRGMVAWGGHLDFRGSWRRGQAELSTTGFLKGLQAWGRRVCSGCECAGVVVGYARLMVGTGGGRLP